MPISSRALGKSKEGSETRDTTVSPKHPTPLVGEDIVQSSMKVEKSKKVFQMLFCLTVVFRCIYRF